MKKILTCVEESPYLDSVCAYADFVSRRLKVAIELLHVQQTEHATKHDYSGAIGAGTSQHLLEQYVDDDEAIARKNSAKGKAILERCKNLQQARDEERLVISHMRGELVETVARLECGAMFLVIGRKGCESEEGELGFHVELLTRNIDLPTLVCPKEYREVKSFLLAYDGREKAKKAVEYLLTEPLLQGMTCQLLLSKKAGKSPEEALCRAGYNVESAGVSKGITEQAEKLQVDLIVMGGYGHTKIHDLFTGCRTRKVLKESALPVLLFS
jgi:hypothetical protein